MRMYRRNKIRFGQASGTLFSRQTVFINGTLIFSTPGRDSSIRKIGHAK